MPPLVNLKVWGSVDTNLVSKLKVAIAAKLKKPYKTGQDTVLVDQTTYTFTVDSVEDEKVSVTVLDPRKA